MDITLVNDILIAIEQHDPETYSHMERTAMYALALAKRLNLSMEECELAYFAGFLHDIGKINVPREILNKRDEINDSESLIVKSHIFFGSNLLMFGHGDFKKIGQLVTTHQEYFDGSGFPKNLKGDQIPLISRITQLADIYDSLRYDSKKMKHQDALLELRKLADTKFDPELVEHFIRAVVKEKLLNFDSI